MKIKELVELMNNNKNKLLKAEQVQAFLKKELEIKEYMSIKQKKELVEDIINACILYEGGVFKFDEIEKYIYFTMKTIAAYTNLELSDDIEEDYDALCKAKMLSPIIEIFNGEYENVRSLLHMRSDYLLNSNTIEAQLGRFFDGVLERVDGISAELMDKIKNFNIGDLPINKETLRALMELVKK